MLDFNHLVNNPNYDFQEFVGCSYNYQLCRPWLKPRGAKLVHILAVGAGGGGGAGINTSANSGGGGGGGSGCQASLLIPAFLLPDILYVHAYRGGFGSTGGSGIGNAGPNTMITFTPDGSSLITNYLVNVGGGNGGGAGALNTGGTGGTSNVTPTISIFPYLAAKSPVILSTFLAGATGGTGGTPSIDGGQGVQVSNTGLMVGGGAGGGGATSTFSGIKGGTTTISYLYNGGETISVAAGGIGALSSGTPATDGQPGLILKNHLAHHGGAGGGGAAGPAVGAIAGNGGDGAPGCGGGGGGGMNSINPTFAKGGEGGPGFCYIFTSF